MSLYNAIFGTNPVADVLLATLGLTRSDVGRFRDAFISDGTIAVYTRNGGGNRSCVHEENPEYGHETCKHDQVIEKEEFAEYEATQQEIEAHPEWKVYNIFIGSKRLVQLPTKVINKYYVCAHPDSIDCTCYGCCASYRLPAHPLYIRDQDDDFDCTYATFYFKFPEEYAEDLKKLDTGEVFKPSQRWTDMLEKIKNANR